MTSKMIHLYIDKLSDVLSDISRLKMITKFDFIIVNDLKKNLPSQKRNIFSIFDLLSTPIEYGYGDYCENDDCILNRLSSGKGLKTTPL